MHIIWPRVFSANLVGSTNFSLFMQEKARSQRAGLLLIRIIFSSKIGNHSYIVILTVNSPFYKLIIGP